MTITEFHTALNIRDWHLDRVARFKRNKMRAGEDVSDLVRSLRISDAITEIVGDGIFADVPDSLLWAVKSAGYVRNTA